MTVGVWHLILIAIASGVVIYLWSRGGQKSNKAPEKEVADDIGKKLHACIINSLSVNEDIANKRLNTPFTAEYIVIYIEEYFSSKGYNGERCRLNYLKHICEGVIPVRLYKVASGFMTVSDSLEGGNWSKSPRTNKTAGEYARGDVLVGSGPRMLEFFLTGELDEFEQDSGAREDKGLQRPNRNVVREENANPFLGLYDRLRAIEGCGPATALKICQKIEKGELLNEREWRFREAANKK